MTEHQIDGGEVAEELRESLRGALDSDWRHLQVRELRAILTVTHQWQPIETAPKDGNPILLAGQSCGKSYVAEAAWSFGDWSFFGNWCHLRPREDELPTHWMPLPPPPKASGSDRDG